LSSPFGSPHEQALSQLLTDFFSSAGVGVHTLVLAGDLEFGHAAAVPAATGVKSQW
jgi:hypothetical protein